MTQTETPTAAAVRGSQGCRSNERDAPENTDTVGATQASAPRDAPAEIDRHDPLLRAILIQDFISHPRFRNEIDSAFRRGPTAMFELLDEIARSQDLRDVADMIEGAADCTPETQCIILCDAIALIEGVLQRHPAQSRGDLAAPETQGADRGDQAGQQGPMTTLAPDLLRTIIAIIFAVRREGRAGDAEQELQTIETYVQHLLRELEPGASCASDLRRNA
jgi:hypothetical protein